MEERRKMKRFNLSLEAMLYAYERNQNDRFMVLLTKNISSAGAFLATGEPLPLNARVNLGFVLQQELGNPDNDGKFMINTSGRVVRVTEKGMGIRFDKKCEISQMDDGGRNKRKK